MWHQKLFMAREVTSQRAVIIVPSKTVSIFSIHCPAGPYAKTSQTLPVFSAKDDSASPDGILVGRAGSGVVVTSNDPVRPVL